MGVRIERLSRGNIRRDPGCLNPTGCELIAAEGVAEGDKSLEGVTFGDLGYEVINQKGNQYEIPCPNLRCNGYIRVITT